MKKTIPFRLSKILAKPVCFFLFPVRVQNKENVPKTGKVIICSNHVCMKDPIFLSLKPRRMIRYMAKKELFENWFVRWLITSLGAFPIERGKGDAESLNYADKVLQEGDALGIFIEGTRSKDGKLGRPRSGAVMLAYRNQAPILPVCITTKNGKPPKIFHKAILTYGELIPFEDLGLKEGTGTEFREASRLVMRKIAEMREKDQPVADSFR